jgi:hypothetical protein
VLVRARVTPHRSHECSLRDDRAARVGERVQDCSLTVGEPGLVVADDGERALQGHVGAAHAHLAGPSAQLGGQGQHHGAEARPLRGDGRVDPERLRRLGADGADGHRDHRPVQRGEQVVVHTGLVGQREQVADRRRARERHGVDGAAAHRVEESLRRLRVEWHRPPVDGDVDRVGAEGAQRARQVGLAVAVPHDRDALPRPGRLDQCVAQLERSLTDGPPRHVDACGDRRSRRLRTSGVHLGAPDGVDQLVADPHALGRAEQRPDPEAGEHHRDVGRAGDHRLDPLSQRGGVAERLGAHGRAFDHLGTAPSEQLDLLLPAPIRGDRNRVAGQRGDRHGPSVASACYGTVAAR